MEESLIYLVVGGILAFSILSAWVAIRTNIPTLIVFLLLGVVLGVGGVADLDVINIDFASTIGTIGLVAILFEGGMSTSMRRLREVIVPASLLSTIGVFATAIIIGVAAHFLFDLPWIYAMLLGSVVSSTDAAAVFSTLRFTKINRRLARILEAESGFNDPMAIALTIGFITWIQQPTFHLSSFVMLITQQLGIGLIAGIVFGKLAMMVFSRIPHTVGSFAPVASVAAALITFSATDLLGGSGFLAVYMVAIAIGSTPSRYRSNLTTFHQGLAFVSQVVMFTILGLLAVPKELMAVAVPSIVLAMFMVLVARPLAIWISLPFGKMLSFREKALVGWAGLRGSVPIVLAAYVLSENLPMGDVIFNIVFFVVLASTLLQGTTLNWVAHKLGLVEKIPEERLEEYRKGASKVYFRVAPQHSISSAQVFEVGLPNKAKIIEIRRRGKYIEFDGDTTIRYGDLLTIEAPYSIHPELEDVFTRWRQRI